MAACPEPIDFVPDPCAANAITQCINTRACKLEDFNAPSLGVGGLLDIQLGATASFTASVNESNACLLAALAQAFASAGCEFPIVAPPLPTPDFTECLENTTEQIDEVSDPLGYLSDTFRIDFDENGVPVRIRV